MFTQFAEISESYGMLFQALNTDALLCFMKQNSSEYVGLRTRCLCYFCSKFWSSSECNYL